MLEEITLKNFQAHKSLTIKFDPKITSIIGSSDVGKSAILRALRWLCLNRGTTKVLRRRGSKFTKVILTVDGMTITRTRGKGNKYVVNNKAYRAIGNNVPAAVQTILNTSEINFQLQHDAPFWFSKSSGQVSKELNQIVNLGLIDAVLGNVANRLRVARAKVEVGETRLASAIAAKEELEWVREMEKEYRQVCLLEQTAARLLDQACSAEEIINEITKAELLVTESKAVLEDLRWCVDIETKAHQAEKQVRRIENLIELIEKEESKLCQLRNKRKEKEELLYRKLKGRCPLCGKIQTQS